MSQQPNQPASSAGTSVRPSRTVILHAGTHKTGSTSIQALLRDQWRNIRAHGTQVILDWPPRKLYAANCASIAHSFVRPELLTTTRIDNQRPAIYRNPAALEALRQQIENSACDRFILSAEAFCYMRTVEERELLVSTFRALNCTLVPLLYFRNKDDWRTSWSAQIDKYSRTREFRYSHPEQFTLLDDWYFDQAALFHFWRGVNPHAILLDYDKVVARHDSVIPTFLRFTGLPQSLARQDYFENRRHDIVSA